MTHRNGIFLGFFLLLAGCSMADGSSVPTNEGGAGGSGGEGGSTASASMGAGGASGGQGGGGGGSAAPCDEADSCGDYSRGCTGCAVKGACAMAYDGCFNDASCLDFNMCMAVCGTDVACQGDCATMNPLGADRYNALVTCVICQACPTSCVELASICP